MTVDYKHLILGNWLPGILSNKIIVLRGLLASGFWAGTGGRLPQSDFGLL
jgi:hypothetical protein